MRKDIQNKFLELGYHGRYLLTSTWVESMLSESFICSNMHTKPAREREEFSYNIDCFELFLFFEIKSLQKENQHLMGKHKRPLSSSSSSESRGRRSRSSSSRSSSSSPSRDNRRKKYSRDDRKKNDRRKESRKGSRRDRSRLMKEIYKKQLTELSRSKSRSRSPKRRHERRGRDEDRKPRRERSRDRDRSKDRGRRDELPERNEREEKKTQNGRADRRPNPDEGQILTITAAL